MAGLSWEAHRYDEVDNVAPVPSKRSRQITLARPLQSDTTPTSSRSFEIEADCPWAAGALHRKALAILEELTEGFGKVSGMTGSGSVCNSLSGHGGRDRDRTCDPYHVK